MVAERFERFRLVSNKENIGYSRGVNRGIELSKGGMILVLNPDIVVGEGSIDNLVSFVNETPDAGIAGAKLLYPDGRLQYSCRSFYTIKALLLRRTFLGKLFPRARALREHLLMDYDHETPRRVDWILGACMMVRREAVEKVGRMDERFFLYFEDIDWCHRMKNQGWSVYYVPQSVMIHSYERSSAGSILRKPFVIHLLSMLRYYEKWNKVFYFLRRHRDGLKSAIFVLSDLAALNLSFFGAYYLRYIMQSLFVYELYPLDWYYYFMVFYNLMFMLTFLFGGLYRIHRETGFMEETLRVARSVFTVFAILLAATYLSRIRIYSRMVLFVQAVLSILAVPVFRWIIRCIHRELVKANFDLKRILLVGNRDEVDRLADSLSSSPELGIDIVGHIDDDPDSLGTVKDLARIVETFKVQEVIILPSYRHKGSLLPFMVHSRGRMIQVKVVSPLARFLGRGVHVEDLAGINVFSVDRGTVFLARRALKRLIDISAALILLLPVAFFSAVYRVYGKITGRVKFFIEARGPAGTKVISWPRAVKKDGKEAADIFKFEFCLLLIIGRLSLVGPPCPLPSWSVNGLGGDIYSFRPGITGKWRVSPSGDREETVEKEVFEIQNWSFTGEVVILARSLRAAFSGKYPEWFFENGRDS